MLAGLSFLLLRQSVVEVVPVLGLDGELVLYDVCLCVDEGCNDLSEGIFPVLVHLDTIGKPLHHSLYGRDRHLSIEQT